MQKARVPQLPRCGTKNEGNKRQRGVFLFPHFILDKQNKVGRPEAKKVFHTTDNATLIHSTRTILCCYFFVKASLLVDHLRMHLYVAL